MEAFLTLETFKGIISRSDAVALVGSEEMDRIPERAFVDEATTPARDAIIALQKAKEMLERPQSLIGQVEFRWMEMIRELVSDLRTNGALQYTQWVYCPPRPNLWRRQSLTWASGFERSNLPSNICGSGIQRPQYCREAI
ncbi:hypothetical protein FA10DRAFT_49388 [Acaromyces ingoldii]|uniref:Uncharacterized protein n=1 Tax=Acaromyces ingoldii TaxID=215250 RepID=A0A316YDA1_9BASI|nr:hypothetical protein FA10DRAFT_49388 [Acaromyces ingoldii]PWN86638.1 hypothetical protein FA10DRAFT_49388 [Acaromyces ingoldii]